MCPIKRNLQKFIALINCFSIKRSGIVMFLNTYTIPICDPETAENAVELAA